RRAAPKGISLRAIGGRGAARVVPGLAVPEPWTATARHARPISVAARLLRTLRSAALTTQISLADQSRRPNRSATGSNARTKRVLATVARPSAAFASVKSWFFGIGQPVAARKPSR